LDDLEHGALEDNSTAYGRGRRYDMKFYYKQLEKWTMQEKSSLLTVLYLLIISFFVFYSGAQNNLDLQAILVALVIIDLLATGHDRKLSVSNLLRRIIITLISVPIAWRFRIVISNYYPYQISYSWIFRHLVGGFLLYFPKKFKPDMIKNAELNLALLYLGKLALESEKSNDKSKYWEFYRTLRILGRASALPSESKSFGIFWEVGQAIQLSGEAAIKLIAEEKIIDYQDILTSLQRILVEKSKSMLLDFIKNLCVEYNFDDHCCQHDWKMASSFANHYNAANFFNKSINKLKIIQVQPAELLLERRHYSLLSQVCKTGQENLSLSNKDAEV